MKTLALLAFCLTSSAAFATSSLSCMNNNNGDLFLELLTDAQKTVKQVSLSNVDWGGAGKGDLQDVQIAGTNSYLVVTDAKSVIGIVKGTRLELSLKDSRVQSADLGGDRYSCQYDN